MWIFSKTGFISVVQHHDGPEWMLVRARTLDDLEEWFLSVDFDPVDYDVEFDPHADYWWRVKVRRETVVTIVAQQLLDLDYTTNVKGNIDKGDPDRHSALLKCWRAFEQLQREHDFEEPGHVGSVSD